MISIYPEPIKVRKRFLWARGMRRGQCRAGERRLQRASGGSEASAVAEVGLQNYFLEVHGWIQSVFRKCWKITFVSEMLSHCWKVWCSQHGLVFCLPQKTIKQIRGQINNANSNLAQFILHLLPSRTATLQEFRSTTDYSLAKKCI